MEPEPKPTLWFLFFISQTANDPSPVALGLGFIWDLSHISIIFLPPLASRWVARRIRISSASRRDSSRSDSVRQARGGRADSAELKEKKEEERKTEAEIPREKRKRERERWCRGERNADRYAFRAEAPHVRRASGEGSNH